jgi:GNAT superfamily N-acetyltransferase
MKETRGTPGTKRSAPIGDNLTRMIMLAEDVFDMHNDPEQIQVDARIIARLKRIHPASVSEQSTRQGPTAWMLVFPTSSRLMELFIGKKISEREMLRRTRVGNAYDAVYLCSVLVLPEYRGKGLAQRLAVRAVKAIQQQHTITCLFYWPFSGGGEKLAEAVAHKLHLPLYTRSH